MGGLSIQSCVANDINKILFTSEVNNTLMGTCQTNKMLHQKKVEKKETRDKQTHFKLQIREPRKARKLLQSTKQKLRLLDDFSISRSNYSGFCSFFCASKTGRLCHLQLF